MKLTPQKLEGRGYRMVTKGRNVQLPAVRSTSSAVRAVRCFVTPLRRPEQYLDTPNSDVFMSCLLYEKTRSKIYVGWLFWQSLIGCDPMPKLFSHICCGRATHAPVESIFSQSRLVMRPHSQYDQMLETLVYFKCNIHIWLDQSRGWHWKQFHYDCRFRLRYNL